MITMITTVTKDIFIVGNTLNKQVIGYIHVQNEQTNKQNDDDDNDEW